MALENVCCGTGFGMIIGVYILVVGLGGYRRTGIVVLNGRYEIKIA